MGKLLLSVFKSYFLYLILWLMVYKWLSLIKCYFPTTDVFCSKIFESNSGSYDSLFSIHIHQTHKESSKMCRNTNRQNNYLIYIYIYMLLFHYIARTVYLIPENLYSRNTTVQFIFQETRMIFFMISQATQHNICLLHERYMNTCRKCYQWKSVVRIYLLLPFFSCYSDFILILDKWRQLNNRQKHNFIKIII